MQLVYLPGINENADQSIFRHFKNHYRSIKNITYNTFNADEAANQLWQSFKCIKKEDNDIYAIGNTIGGFWANYFAGAGLNGCFLINPFFKPSYSLQKYLGKTSASLTGKQPVLTKADCNLYQKYESEFLDDLIYRKTVIGNENPDAIDFGVTDIALAYQLLENKNMVVIEGIEIGINNKHLRVIEKELAGFIEETEANLKTIPF